MAVRECKDDPSIADDALLLRRIPAAWVVQDSVETGLRPSSAAFDGHRDGSPMSVVLAEVLENAGRPLSDALAAHEGFGLVCGTKTRAVKKRLARASRWVVGPQQVAGGHK